MPPAKEPVSTVRHQGSTIHRTAARPNLGLSSSRRQPLEQAGQRPGSQTSKEGAGKSWLTGSAARAVAVLTGALAIAGANRPRTGFKGHETL